MIHTGALCLLAVIASTTGPTENASGGKLSGLVESPFQVDEIRIIGNGRTRDAVIRKEIQVAHGDILDRDDPPLIRQRVMNLELFSTVAVSGAVEEGRRVLTVEVDERWTLIPLPIVGGSGTGFTIGGIAAETNFLGWNKTLAVGGFYSPQGSLVLLFYQDPGVLQSRVLLEANGSYSTGPKRRYEKDRLLEAFEDRVFSVSLLGGYALGDSAISNSLNLYVGFFASAGSTDVFEDGAPPPRRQAIWGPTVSARYNGQDFKLFTSEGIRLEITFSQALEAWGAGRDLSMTDALFNGSYVLPWGHAVSLTTSLALRTGDRFLDSIPLGGRMGNRGFRDDGLWASNAVFGTVEYLLPIFRFGGTWALSAYADLGFAEWADEDLTYANPGGGPRFFLEDIAIPALGIDVTYNPRDRIVRPSFVLGLEI